MLLDIVKQQIETEDSGKLVDFLLSELVSYFENLVESIPEKLWISLLGLLKWTAQLRHASTKHLDKGSPGVTSL